MKIIDIKKKYQGKFITYYEAIYKLNNGEIKNYELVSRDHNLNIDSIGNGDITGVGLVCYSVNHDKKISISTYHMLYILIMYIILFIMG